MLQMRALICFVLIVPTIFAVVTGEEASVLFDVPETQLTEQEIKFATEFTSIVRIVMSVKEVALFGRYLARATSYFEFGCGGSTVLACRSGSDELSITSVDSSQEWVDIVRENPDVAWKASKHILSIKYVDIGPTAQWGYPTQSVEESQGSWYLYSQAISMTGKSYDLIFVDGRFRVASFLNSHLSNPEANILLHDFFCPHHYEAYKDLLKLFDVVDRAETLVALRVKEHVKKEDIMKMYAMYINVSH